MTTTDRPTQGSSGGIEAKGFYNHNSNLFWASKQGALPNPFNMKKFPNLGSSLFFHARGRQENNHHAQETKGAKPLQESYVCLSLLK